jgi:hypothetical protein
MVTSRFFPRARKYAYHVKMAVWDDSAGKTILRRRMFYSQKELTVGSILETAMSLWGWDAENYGVTTQAAQYDFAEMNETYQ